MAYFAFVDGSSTIRQLDTTKPSMLPYPVHNGESNIWSLAFTADKEFELVWGPGDFEIRRTKGAKTDTPVYKHPIWLASVRIRTVGGVERVYFSARKDKTSGIYEIYYLAGTTPKLYATIDPQKLTFPNPCVPTAADWFSYSGDFTFDDSNNMYLSSGNFSGPKIGLQVGIYRITGAGPDTVTGSVERIYLGDGPIESLCYLSPQILYFRRNYEIWKLNLSTMAAALEGQIKTSNPTIHIRDMAYVKDGLLPTWWWPVMSALKQLLSGK
jgi:hypothetical protein